MFIDAKVLKKKIKEEAKTGLDVLLKDGKIHLVAGMWALSFERLTAPTEVLGTLVELMGELPEEAAYTVQAKADPQAIMPEAVMIAEKYMDQIGSVIRPTREVNKTPFLLKGLGGELVRVVQTPEPRENVLVFEEYLDMLSPGSIEVGEEYPQRPVLHNGMLIWVSSVCLFAVSTIVPNGEKDKRTLEMMERENLTIEMFKRTFTKAVRE